MIHKIQYLNNMILNNIKIMLLINKSKNKLMIQMKKIIHKKILIKVYKNNK